MTIPDSRLKHCTHCATPVDIRSPYVHRRVEAWIPCARIHGNGTNQASMMDDLDTFICKDCYEKVKKGKDPVHPQLF